MSHDLPDYQSWDDSSSNKSYEQLINYEKSLLKVLCLQILQQYSFKTRLDCHKTDMCAVVGHQVAEFNTAISCPTDAADESSILHE